MIKWMIPTGIGAGLGLVAPGWVPIIVIGLALLVVRLLILREWLQK